MEGTLGFVQGRIRSSELTGVNGGHPRDAGSHESSFDSF